MNLVISIRVLFIYLFIFFGGGVFQLIGKQVS